MWRCKGSFGLNRGARMNDFNRAIERMKKKEAACNTLITEALQDIRELKKRRENARKVIAAAEKLKDMDVGGPNYQHTLDCVRMIADGPEEMVSCMGTGIRV